FCARSRVGFVRGGAAASRLVGSPGSMELFALRALTRQPLRRLGPLGPDLAGRFRGGGAALLRQGAALAGRSGAAVSDGPPGGLTRRPHFRAMALMWCRNY